MAVLADFIVFCLITFQNLRFIFLSPVKLFINSNLAKGTLFFSFVIKSEVYKAVLT